MDFSTYKDANLERIAGDPRFKEHHAEVNAILSTRPKHLHVTGAIELLRDVAAQRETIGYKAFYERLTGAKTSWSQGKATTLAKFLSDLMVRTEATGLPVLSSLVVRQSDDRCGPGFFRDLVRIGRAAEDEDADAAEIAQREICWNWAVDPA